MNPEDQDYPPQEEQPQQGDRYSQQNNSHNPEGRNKRNRRRGGSIGNKFKQNIRNRFDPRAKFSREGLKQQIKEVRKELVKKVAKEAAKKAALSPWTWIIIGVIALIIFLVVLINGIDEEENKGDCVGAGTTSSASASSSAALAPGQEPPAEYQRTTYGGKPVNQRTKVMLENAAKIAKIPSFAITQGSYNVGGVEASKGTHDGGGVVDISTGGMDTAKINEMIKALRMAGFAAWYRTPAEGFSPHIHAVAIGDKELAQGAAAQVKNYFDGLSGLGSGTKDTAPASVGRPFPEWAKKYANGAQPSGGGDTGGSGDCVCAGAPASGSAPGAGWDSLVKNGEQYGAKWKEFLEAAKKVAEEEDYPLAVMVAQGALESGHGTSALAKGRNAFFGVNAVDSNPNQATGYSSPEESIRDYVRIIKTEERYKEAYAARGDPKKMVELIKAAGYASDPNYVNKVTNSPEFQALAGTGGGGGGSSDCGGATAEGYVAPSTNDCGGKYNIAALPGSKNYGDPSCSFSKDKLNQLIKQKDPKNAELWFNTIVPGESNFNPNARAGTSAPGQAALDAGGAWGLYQMGSSTPPGQAPPAPGKNGPLDRGDVNWELQTGNAIDYNKNQGCSFRYWATARAQWGKLGC